MYKCFRLFTVIFLLSSCGASDDLLFVSLNSKQPKVVSILPESGSLVAKDAHIANRVFLCKKLRVSKMF